MAALLRQVHLLKSDLRLNMRPKCLGQSRSPIIQSSIRHIYLSFAIFVTTLFTLNSSAFTLTQDNLHGFPYKELRVSLNTADCADGVESDLDFAIELWNNVPGSRLTLVKESPNDIDPSDFTALTFLQTIVVGCSTTFNADTGGVSLTTIGVGTSSRLGAPYLKKGIIILNEEGGAGQYSTKSTAVRRYTMAHELGHVLGLGHSSVLESLMYPSVATKSDTNLHQDDIDGIVYLYPIDEIEDDMLYGCGSISNTDSNTPANFRASSAVSLMAFLFLIFLPLLFTFALRFHFFRVKPA